MTKRNNPLRFAALLLGPMGFLGLGCLEGQLATADPTPYADAGFDQIVYLGSQTELTIELDGRASCAPGGSAVSSATWSMLEGPGIVNVDVSAVGTLQAFFSTSTPGTYLFSLKVTADERESGPDFVEIRVREGQGENSISELPETDACGNNLS